MTKKLPLVLIVDDVLGRRHAEGPNEERENVCAHFLLHDVTGDSGASSQIVRQPIARAHFIRGQTPVVTRVGDNVENDLEGIVRAVRKGWSQTSAERWSLVLLDLSFLTGSVTEASNRETKGVPPTQDVDLDPERYFGLTVLRRLSADFPDLPIVIMSTRERARVALALATHGAMGFVETDAADGEAALQEVLYRHALVPDSTGKFAGKSLGLMQALRAARRASLHNQNVLISGESGVGKELLAEYLNTVRANRTKRPYCVVNSAILAADSFGRELFGYRKGAFPEAQFDRMGMIELANRGDVFLDEVSALPPAVQAGLLRVVEEGKLTPVGGGQADSKKVSVRFICASSADLEAKSDDGSFRRDLLERIKRGGTIDLPPLRERREDIAPLLEHFVRQAEEEIGARHREIADEAVARCTDYDWPMNVRQLRNCAYAAVSAHPDVDFLLAPHLDLKAAKKTPTALHSSIDRLIEALEEMQFDALSDVELEGRLPKLEAAVGSLLLRYLRVALARHTRPDGRMFIQPAMQFAMGDEELSATTAYDIVKRVAKRAGLDIGAADPGDVLRLALERSLRGRQRKSETES